MNKEEMFKEIKKGILNIEKTELKIQSEYVKNIANVKNIKDLVIVQKKNGDNRSKLQELIKKYLKTLMINLIDMPL